MAEQRYTDERNTRILIAVLKAHGIHKVVASPGVRNISFTGSVQNDPWFQVFSAVDERHAAYMAVGMAAESGEVVVLSCTQATAGRNYLPAMTEAFYRKIPVLAVTSMVDDSRNRQLMPQTIEQLNPPCDAYRYSVCCREVRTDKEAMDCERFVNEAVLELWRAGGGPVNINLVTSFLSGFSVDSLPTVRKISRFSFENRQEWPVIPSNAKVAVFLGSRREPRNSDAAVRERAAVESFVDAYDAVVLCDSTSEYCGRGRVDAELLFAQKKLFARPQYRGLRPDVIIHAGEVSGSRIGSALLKCAPVWRVSEDGEVRDLRGKLVHVFAVSFGDFCGAYAKGSCPSRTYLEGWRTADANLRQRLPDLPYSNYWIAHRMHRKLPAGARLHLGIYNSLRSWNCFPVDSSVRVSANVGGFGIDGCVSTLIGASLAASDRLCFGVFGDLAFFYDLNALGNRHVGSNLRILLVNNGTGAEFNLYRNPGAAFGERVNDFIAAGGHFGNRSATLVRHYAEDIGFEYLSAKDKASFDDVLPEFLSAGCGRPILLECFTTAADESEALRLLEHIEPEVVQSASKPTVLRKLVDKLMG